MGLVYDEAKFTEMLLYATDHLRHDRAGGATKLNKIIFFAEFTHLRRHGTAISACEFQKLEHGPAPRPLAPVRNALAAEGDAEQVATDFLGYVQQRLVPVRQADPTIFTAEELETIDDVLNQLQGLTGNQISDLSHDEPGWQLTAPGESIPYAAAFLGAEQRSTPTSKRLSEQVAERYQLTTSR